MTTYEQGRLIWAAIPDNNGNAKPEPRPAMVESTITVSGDDDIVQVIAGSTDVRSPLPSDQVLIHDSYQQDRITKLRKPTVLICSWRAGVRAGDIKGAGGYLRGARSLPIIRKANEIEAAKTRQP